MPSQGRESLAVALERVAAAVEQVLSEASAVHGQYIRLRELDGPAQDSQEAAEDETRHRRTQMGLYSANLLVERLRDEAQEARERYPTVDAAGESLPPTPPSTEPHAVQDWWHDLSEQDQELLITRHPRYVGQADGLPPRVRHRANLQVLDAEIARRRALAAQAPPAAEGEEPDEATVQEERDMLGLHMVKALFARDPGEWAEALAGVTAAPEDRFLYLLDAREYPLKAAVVLGDLDYCEFAAIHVPGATTTVDNRLFRELTWMSNLRDECGRLVGDVGRVAIMDWIGYQTPSDVATRRAVGNSGMSVLVPGEATDDRFARAGAPSLIRCAEGVRALVGPHVRLTASGHSYGGAVTGLALHETDVFDAAVVAGCPGVFATTLDELRVPKDSMYAVLAPGDLAALMGVFGGQVIQIPGIQLFAPVPRTTTYPDGQRILLRLAVGHETYYDPGTSSLHGMAGVLIGDRGRVKTTSLSWLSRITSRAGATVPPLIAPIRL